MKQVVFAIALLAMASLTGCLNTDDTSVDENTDTTDDSTSDTTEDNTDTKDDTDTTDDTKDDELIEPVGTNGGYSPPENSNIRMDSGVRYIVENNEIFECTKQGYEDLVGDGYEVYCDLDYHSDNGPQVWVNKTGKTITVECIASKPNQSQYGSYCKDSSNWNLKAWLLFTSSEGLQERILVDLANTRAFQTSGNDTYETTFFKSEFTLKFEPISVSIEEGTISDLYYPEETNTRVF